MDAKAGSAAEAEEASAARVRWLRGGKPRRARPRRARPRRARPRRRIPGSTRKALRITRSPLRDDRRMGSSADAYTRRARRRRKRPRNHRRRRHPSPCPGSCAPRPRTTSGVGGFRLRPRTILQRPVPSRGATACSCWRPPRSRSRSRAAAARAPARSRFCRRLPPSRAPSTGAAPRVRRVRDRQLRLEGRPPARGAQHARCGACCFWPAPVRGIHVAPPPRAPARARSRSVVRPSAPPGRAAPPPLRPPTPPRPKGSGSARARWPTERRTALSPTPPCSPYTPVHASSYPAVRRVAWNERVRRVGSTVEGAEGASKNADAETLGSEAAVGSARGLRARERGASHGRRQRTVRGGPAGIEAAPSASRCGRGTGIRRGRGSLSWRRRKPREPVHLSRPRMSVNLSLRFSAWQVRFKPIASEASPHVLPQPLRTTHGHRSLTRAHRDVRVDITAKLRPGRAGSCVPRRRVSRLGVSRVLGAFSRLLARSRIGGLNRRVIVLRLERGAGWPEK